MASQHGRRLTLTRTLAFFDLETTGLWPERDRIVEIAIVKVSPAGVHDEFHSLINPECRISKEATAIHGIRNRDVRDAPTFRTLAPRLVGTFARCDLGGFNVSRFDLPFLKAEFARAGVAFDMHRRNVIDVQTIFHRQEPRDLGAAVRFYCGKDHASAHSALADARACVGILQAQVQRYEDLPTSTSQLAELFRAEASPYLDSGRWFEPRDDKPFFARGKHAGQSLTEVVAEAPDYLDWMLTLEDLPEDTKDLIRQSYRRRGR